MNKNYTSLELNKILQLLANQTSCADSTELALKLQPSCNLEEVRSSLKNTSDAHMLVGRFGGPSFGGLVNIKNSLKRASSGGLLTMGELLKISQSLRVIRTVKEWRERSSQVIASIDEMFDLLSPNKYLEDKITSAILSEDEMADTASNELASIRRNIRAASLRLRQQLDKMIRSSTYQKYLQDAIVTIRDGRFVVPVKSEYRNEVPGLIHDASASGATVFIEPISVVEANNEIRVLKLKENAEIERILFELSAECGNFEESILSSYDISVKLNLIFAKAHLAYKMKASEPKINHDGKILLKKARHPLINPLKVVPIDIELGYNFDVLVVTGPNTGGKTVSIKTIGLLTLMAMCGLMIPADENSSISIFQKILVDIGDEQSIEQSLSTFSGHMTNIINIISEADSESLILLDELGAGTDPVEGAALATAILEELKYKDAKIISTTHYAELKEYAIATDRIENACCEFDVTTLRPTYKLLVGVPGRSNAFAISEKLGISHHIVEHAKQLISEEKTRFEDVVKSLESTRQELQKEQEEIHRLNLETEKLRNQTVKEREKLENEKKIILEEAQKKASLLVSKTRSQADAIISELEALRKNNKILSDQERITLKTNLRSMEKHADPVISKSNDDYILPRKLKPGDLVLIFDLDKKATVLEEADSSNNILIQAGIMKTRVPVKQLRLLDSKPKKIHGSSTRTVKSRAEVVVNRDLDLRGQSSFEAISEIDSFIDSALISGINQLTIIHGKGTGVLRKAVHQHLKTHPSVRTFRLGVFGEGDSGVTIVELK